MRKADIQGKTAVVTGGTRGIGLEIARALVTEGAHVVICGRDAQRAEAAAAELSRSGPGKCAGIGCDVKRYAAVEALMRHAAETYGGLDILVNNAGVAGGGPVTEYPLDKWDDVIGTNLTGVFYCCRAAIPYLRKRGGGYILNIGSLAGVNAMPNLSVYNASKFGLLGFSEAIMQELRYDGIKVSTILPGSVATEFGGRAAKDPWRLGPSDIADVVLHLLSHDPRSLPSRVEIRPSQPPKKG
jgi:3-oxoacyl-[acyl-carrier protein] reductase